ncbi:hypothetical protein FKOIJHOC_00054 [Acinetobacter phage Ab_121]|nr:hypothetical protein FKOIJHOC_00054 [Acinetobacter phage Ab_121]
MTLVNSVRLRSIAIRETLSMTMVLSYQKVKQ